jgi:hypothetical protein
MIEEGWLSDGLMIEEGLMDLDELSINIGCMVDECWVNDGWILNQWWMNDG